MKACEKCGVECDVKGRETGYGTWVEHTPERRRDRLADRLAEATKALEGAHDVLGNCEDHQGFAAKCARCIIEKALGYT